MKCVHTFEDRLNSCCLKERKKFSLTDLQKRGLPLSGEGREMEVTGAESIFLMCAPAKSRKKLTVGQVKKENNHCSDLYLLG